VLQAARVPFTGCGHVVRLAPASSLSSAGSLGAMVRQRSPRAVRVRGGRWIRPPKPKPKPQPPEEAQPEKSEVYENCEPGDSRQFVECLIAAVQPAVDMLQCHGDQAAADSVLALCDFLKTREKAHARHRPKYKKLKRKLADAQSKVAGNANLQGQNTRYWHRIQQLQRRLFLVRVPPARHSLQWLPP
jgi:hypothetical protein